VGFIAAQRDEIAWLMNFKAVSCISSASVMERVVYRLLSEGMYRHICDQVRAKLDEARRGLVTKLVKAGLTVDGPTDSGMYIWASLPNDVDAMTLANMLFEQGFPIAPGRVFGESVAFKSRVRFNVATTLDSRVLGPLSEAIARL